MEDTKADLLARARSKLHDFSSLFWAGGLGLTAGILTLSASVVAGLAAAGSVVVGTLTLLVLLALHVKFIVAGPWWIVAVQAWLTYLPITVFGAAWTPVCGLLSGALLVMAGRIHSTVLVALALACGPVLLFAPDPSKIDPGWAIAGPLVGLVEYTLVTLARRARLLAEARTEVMRKAVALERRRFTRDLHDLVGHRLTVLVLKTQLLHRLVAEGDERAGDEVNQMMELLTSLSADVRAVAHGLRSSSLSAELGSARLLLESVRVRCQIKVACRELPGEVEEALTHALREGVTNVLRHAEARQCSIHLIERDQLVRLSIRNDGVRPPRRPGDAGQGLLNLAERVSGLGGWLEATSSRSGQFAFHVFVPQKK
ncbi:sensor histidine kinase [Nonomuraea jiangxiensis]|uniref:Two-component system, NarL family, sensor histidine kinase DesK n=1 Tax=Nonomuraea jiangxiensis TaxID=633440 RepID=A0A1G8D9I2_9ACTN|nr:histidine kinase [Nonomuraea jiangxiensis]SDH53940.1 two-component system, NarL family, sensor histidine kinase DesK [Nonomuraea jiangxiensis]